MTSSIMIKDGALRLNRALLLRKLGVQYDLPFTGDIEGTRTLNFSAMNAVKVHQMHAPFVNFGVTSERCSGSVLVRVERTTVAVPCFNTHVKDAGSVCAHCEELWNSGPDDTGFFTIDKRTMKHAVAHCKQGAGKQ